MLMVLLKTLIIYAYLLLIMRLMGKREVGQLQTFELVVSMIIADVAAVPIYDEKASLFNVIISVGTLFLLHVIIAIINLKSVKGREILCGRPRILIEKGKIDEEALKKEFLTINENIYPDYALVVCKDDGSLWVFDKSAVADPVNGKFKAFASGDDTVIQMSVMPTADETTVDKVYQYIGATDAEFVQGYWYIGVDNGDGTYDYFMEFYNGGCCLGECIEYELEKL